MNETSSTRTSTYSSRSGGGDVPITPTTLTTITVVEVKNVNNNGDRQGSYSTDRGLSVPSGEHPLAWLPPADATPLSTQRTQTQSPPTTTTSVGADKSPPPLHPISGGDNQKPTQWPVMSTCGINDYSTIARLGFPPSFKECVCEAERRALPILDEEERHRERVWHAACRGVPLLASASPSAVEALRAMARAHGIPKSLRGVMWLTLTGAAVKIDENEYFCRTLLRSNGFVSGPYGRAIEADLERTFPGHPYFSSADVGLYKLKNVLHALCWRNALLRYCQSFNYLSAFLLLVLDDEERVFWLLTHILEVLLPNDFYGESLIGARVDQAVLEKLVPLRLPRLAQRFQSVGFEVSVMLPAWVMSLFVNTFPVETTLRVWDYMFTESANPYEKTTAHLEVVLAVLKMHEADLLHCEDAGEMMVWLQEQTSMLYDSRQLLHIARKKMKITAAELHLLRRSVKPKVLQDIHEREILRAEMRERRLAMEARSEWGSLPDEACEAHSEGPRGAPEDEDGERSSGLAQEPQELLQEFEMTDLGGSE